ncbi:MAG TPA: HAMP domain-containing sensor histidine kinase, partial [Chryseolinea sp.]
MSGQKNLITRILMISSMLLLVALQALWLKNSYEKAYFDFRKETSMLLKNTMGILRDSLFVSVQNPLPPDSIIDDRNFVFHMDSLSLKSMTGDSAKASSKQKLIISQDSRAVSLGTALKSSGRQGSGAGLKRSFIVRLGPDSLDVALLSRYFRKGLDASGITSPFKMMPTPGGRLSPEKYWPEEIERQYDLNTPPVYSDTLVTEPANFFGPFNSYTAAFSGVRAVIIKDIGPQVLFSVLLTMIVLTSFIVIYKNLRAQQKLNELKNDFISNVTHELKTPVATVSVALEALRDFHALDDVERTKEYLTIAQNELSRLTLMTDKILKASTFETRGISYVAERVNLNSIIQQVLSSLKLIFEKHKLNVGYSSSGDGFELLGSEIHLTNVVYNLLDNALKYGNGPSGINLTLTSSDNYIDFTVRDYGIGIAREYQKKIFEKFFRVPTGDVHNVQGYGLGLNYVAGVIQKHGGTIVVESEVGKGSLFKVRLPKTGT